MNTNALNPRQRSIVAIAAFTANGDMNRLKTALGGALDDGLTVSEIKEVLTQSYAYAGFPRSLNGIHAFMDVLEERKARGIEDAPGREPTPAPKDMDRSAYGARVRMELAGQKSVPAPSGYQLFTPAIDQFLKEHLFADIFMRDNLDRQSRELATCAILASIPGLAGQLRFHMAAAMNTGLTTEQMEAFAATLAERVGPAEAAAARAVLCQITGNGGACAVPPANIPEIFERGDPNTAYAQHFVGNSHLKMLVTKGLSVANVTFEPGCRNNWHIHTAEGGGGQLLLCTAGRGWYQEWGRKPQELHAGDVVQIPAGVKHWHGAAKDSWFVHLAIAMPGEKTGNEWLEPVTDDVYMKLP